MKKEIGGYFELEDFGVMKLLQTVILHYKTNQEEWTNGKKLRK